MPFGNNVSEYYFFIKTVRCGLYIEQFYTPLVLLFVISNYRYYSSKYIIVGDTILSEIIGMETLSTSPLSIKHLRIGG